MKPIEEIKFARTVAADIELAKLCPGNNIANIKKLIVGPDTPTVMQNIMKVIVILSEAYENKRHFQDPDYEPNPVTIEELMYFTEDDLTRLSNEAFVAFNEEGQPTVEAESKKNTEKAK